jgi:hypothetical protein
MQVFTPYVKQWKNAKVLDKKRRNKQILEIIQIISANNSFDVGWKIPKYVYNHVNTLKWKGYDSYLMAYLFWLLVEYRNEHEKDECHEYPKSCFYHKSGEIFWLLRKNFWIKDSFILPDWFSRETCYEHQRLLIEKDRKFYSVKFNMN